MTYTLFQFRKLYHRAGRLPNTLLTDAYRDYLQSGVVFSLWMFWFRRGARNVDSDWMVRDQGHKDVKRLKATITRRERDQAYRDCEMTKVRGALGGTYYE